MALYYSCYISVIFQLKQIMRLIVTNAFSCGIMVQRVENDCVSDNHAAASQLISALCNMHLHVTACVAACSDNRITTPVGSYTFEYKLESHVKGSIVIIQQCYFKEFLPRFQSTFNAATRTTIISDRCTDSLQLYICMSKLPRHRVTYYVMMHALNCAGT